MFAACDGTGKLPGTNCQMDGFDKEQRVRRSAPIREYVYVPHSESKPYFDMAHECVLADRMFQSQLDESFVAHQYIIAAQAAHERQPADRRRGAAAAASPTRFETITQDRASNGPKIKPCFDYQTLGDELDEARLSWRFYASTYGSGRAVRRRSGRAIRRSSTSATGPTGKNVISPNWKFITDVRAGKLANFTWITPVCDDSDHVNCGGGYGPSWVAALVNAVGKSKFWNSTAIFVMWDDWGGLYDHVPPPYAITTASASAFR